MASKTCHFQGKLNQIAGKFYVQYKCFTRTLKICEYEIKINDGYLSFIQT